MFINSVNDGLLPVVKRITHMCINLDETYRHDDKRNNIKTNLWLKKNIGKVVLQEVGK
jgi:hypothetical protein